MKKIMVLAMVAAGVLTTPSFAWDDDYLIVVFGDRKETFRDLDLEKVSVCSFKEQVAERFGLTILEFDLIEYVVLDEDRTLYGANLLRGNSLKLRKVTRSYQCD